MIIINEKKNCCGCGACVQCCPKQAIALSEDEEGFWYPNISANACVNCGLCDNVCPLLHCCEKHNQPKVVAAINNNDEIRRNSSSGGMFSLLAEKTLEDGGVIFGAKFDDAWQVTLDYTENLNELSAFRGSKYVQSRSSDTFRQCEIFLKKGRKVLFSGTPCQIAGLKHFLRKEYDNLLTIEVACHGVPSPKLWADYINSIKDKINSPNAYRYIKELKFNVFNGSGPDELILTSNRHENDYTKAFIHSSILRPSCYSCKFKIPNNYADMTIADFWGVQLCDKELDDKMGVSLIVINSKNALSRLKQLNITFKDENWDDVIKYNPALMTSVSDKNRFPHIKMIDDCDIIKKLRESIPLIKESTKQKIKNIIKNIFSSVKQSNHICKNDFERIVDGKRLIIMKIDFRNKMYGWKHYCFAITIKLVKK